MAVRTAKKFTPATDPTSAAQAPVAGIVAPAQPVAVSTGIAPTPATTPAPVTVPPISYTPTPDTTPPITPATIAPAPTAQQVTGIAPVAAQDVPTSENLPDLQNADVTSILNTITSQDSPLMQLARTQGFQAANSRGVLNSSIGVGAAQDSAYRAAVPLAQQQAQEAATSNQQRYDIAAQMDRLRAQAGFEQIARSEGYQYQSALNTSGYAFQAQQLANQQQFEKDMAKVQQGYAVDMAGLQYTLQSKLQSQANTEQIQRMGIDLQNQLKLQAANAKSTLDQIKAQGDVQLTLQANQFAEAQKELTQQLNSTDSVALANASVNLFNAQASLQAALLGNPNMPAAERTAYEQQIAGMVAPVQSYVSSVLGYTPPASTTPAPSTTATPTPAPTSTTPAPTTTGIAPRIPLVTPAAPIATSALAARKVFDV